MAKSTHKFVLEPQKHWFDNPLANSTGYCSWCHGSGYKLNGKICPCVPRKLERELNMCRNKWERLWMEINRTPQFFPRNAFPVSSLSR